MRNLFSTSRDIIPSTCLWLFHLPLAIMLSMACSSIASTPTQTSIIATPSTVINIVTPAPGLLVSIDPTYYLVEGATADELRAQLNQLGPVDKLNQKHDAYTEWYVEWSYPYQTRDGHCTTGPVKVEVTITFILPRWPTSADAPLDLIDQWQNYLAILQRHEDGHKNIAISAGNEILQAMQTLDVYASCSDLDWTAAAVGERILNKYRQEEIIYDLTTGHGTTQGARFP